jgi:hypothetical protein
MGLGLKVILDKSIIIGLVQYVRAITNLKERTMKFETKYNLGDIVWFMYNNKAQRGCILGIEANYSCSHFDDANTPQCVDYSENYTVKICLGHSIRMLGRELFPTKEELLKSL